MDRFHESVYCFIVSLSEFMFSEKYDERRLLNLDHVGDVSGSVLPLTYRARLAEMKIFGTMACLLAMATLTFFERYSALVLPTYNSIRTVDVIVTLMKYMEKGSVGDY